MLIHDTMIKAYLNRSEPASYKNHWLFYTIEPQQYLFETPDEKKEKLVREVFQQVTEGLEHFKPMNEKWFEKLFPPYKDWLKALNVLLVVGCPSPYDAMFKTHEGIDYVVFDLIRLGDYLEQGYALGPIIAQLITHEFAHQCIAQYYLECNASTYEEKLNYIVFNEGLAHLLAFNDPIEEIEWESEKYSQYEQAAKVRLGEALQEKQSQKQLVFLEEADSGPYWEKFGAIAGKIYFGRNLERLNESFQKGYENMLVALLGS